MVIAIISIVAAVLLALYVAKSQDYKQLVRDNKLLAEQQNPVTESASVDGVDIRQLDKVNALEAIRYNGYVPETEGNWIMFEVQNQRFFINSERFPVMSLIIHYHLDHKIWDMELVHKAAGKASDEIIMGKALIDDSEEGVSFQVVAIETEYGHFKECLGQYIDIVEQTKILFEELYQEMAQKQKEEGLSSFYGLNAQGAEKTEHLS